MAVINTQIFSFKPLEIGNHYENIDTIICFLNEITNEEARKIIYKI